LPDTGWTLAAATSISIDGDSHAEYGDEIMATTTEHIVRSARRSAKANGIDLAGLRKQMDKTLRGARKGAGKAAHQGYVAADRYVHRHPWTAVAMAAGGMAIAGLAIGSFFRKRRNRQHA
jgi:ElaB/YqjD/DUF883 family membrane-anchored ribosome-binding protein